MYKINKKLIITVVGLLHTLTVYSEMPAVPVPIENPVTESKRILGKILFWDEQLSSDNTMACGTCHIPSNGGTDPRHATHPGPDLIFGTSDDVIGSMGIAHYDENMQTVEDDVFGFEPQVTGRNTPSFINAMYANDIFWDGRATSEFKDPQNENAVVIVQGGALESQSMAPILSSVEMAKENRTWDEVIAKLISVTPLALANNIPQDMRDTVAANNTYPALFNQAFGDPNITAVRIALAIASYERTLVSDQTPWDLYRAGDNAAMTADQIAGWEFFQNGSDNGGQGGGMGGMGGDGANCAMCHTPPLFTDNKFHNIGLRPAEEDAGRMDVTMNSSDFGRFKTPGLRNIGLKSAMMHVGWITDTMDAIDFYNAGTSDVTSQHIQFTANQSGLPTENPNAPMSPPYSMVAIEVDSEANQAQVADFIDNALTDPRVADEAFPFDRPTLNSEITHPINSGLNGAWFNVNTAGQGIMLEILPDSNQAFFAWFTYDTELSDANLNNTIGSTEQRWLSGLGEINMQDKSITFDVNITSDGLFDNNRAVSTTEANSVGSIVIRFDSCANATLSYDLIGSTLVNSFSMVRITAENNSLCEQQLTGTLKTQNNSKILKNKAADNFQINSGLNGAWFNPDTSGQGFLFEVLPESKQMFLAWFTYDTDLPDNNATSVIGYEGHRWLSGLGDIDVNNHTVSIDLTNSSGGKFDDSNTVTNSESMSYGSLTISFNDCSTAQVEYNLFSLSLTGNIALDRISPSNVALCEQLSLMEPSK